MQWLVLLLKTINYTATTTATHWRIQTPQLGGQPKQLLNKWMGSHGRTGGMAGLAPPLDPPLLLLLLLLILLLLLLLLTELIEAVISAAVFLITVYSKRSICVNSQSVSIVQRLSIRPCPRHSWLRFTERQTRQWNVAQYVYALTLRRFNHHRRSYTNTQKWTGSQRCTE